MSTRPMRNILCVRLDAFGDVLMTEPALRAIYRSMPECRLTLLTSPAGAKAAEMIPYLHQILIYEAPWMKHSAEITDSARHLDFIRHLHAQQFDAAVIFTVYSQNPLPPAMMCYLAGIPRRIAFCRENPYQLLTDWLPEKEPQSLQRHEVERQLALVAEIGATVHEDAIQIAIPEAARRTGESIWQSLAQQGECRIIVHPSATAPSRRYPAERFIAAMKSIQARIPATFIITGDRSEQAIAAEIAATPGLSCMSLAGQIDAREWAALIDSADLLLSNNTGAAHLAAATATPAVVLYALTNPQHTPWRTASQVLSYDVPCKHCYKSLCPQGHHNCLLGISAEEVANAALALLAARFQHPSASNIRFISHIAG